MRHLYNDYLLVLATIRGVTTTIITVQISPKSEESPLYWLMCRSHRNQRSHHYNDYCVDLTTIRGVTTTMITVQISPQSEVSPLQWLLYRSHHNQRSHHYNDLCVVLTTTRRVTNNTFKEHWSSATRDHPSRKFLRLPLTTVCGSVRDILPGVWYHDYYLWTMFMYNLSVLLF